MQSRPSAEEEKSLAEKGYNYIIAALVERLGGSVSLTAFEMKNAGKMYSFRDDVSGNINLMIQS